MIKIGTFYRWLKCSHFAVKLDTRHLVCTEFGHRHLGKLGVQCSVERKRSPVNSCIFGGIQVKVKPVYQQMTLSPKLGVVEISTLWHFRLPLPIQMFIKVVSSSRLSGIGMPFLILWSHPLKMQRIVLLNYPEPDPVVRMGSQTGTAYSSCSHRVH